MPIRLLTSASRMGLVYPALKPFSIGQDIAELLYQPLFSDSYTDHVLQIIIPVNPVGQSHKFYHGQLLSISSTLNGMSRE